MTRLKVLDPAPGTLGVRPARGSDDAWFFSRDRRAIGTCKITTFENEWRRTNPRNARDADGPESAADLTAPETRDHQARRQSRRFKPQDHRTSRQGRGRLAIPGRPGRSYARGGDARPAPPRGDRDQTRRTQGRAPRARVDRRHDQVFGPGHPFKISRLAQPNEIDGSGSLAESLCHT